MALSPRTMHVPAGLPIDESTRPELLDVGRANVANRNVRNIERGALEKRRGFEALPTDILLGGGDIASGRRVFAHGDASVPCVIDGTELHAFSDNANAWVTIGRVPEVGAPKVASLPTPASGAVFCDSEVVGGYLVVAAQKSLLGRPTAAVVDYATGQVVLQHQDLGSVDGHVIVASYSTFVVAFVQDYSTGEIKFYRLNTASLTSGWVYAGVAASSSSTGCLASTCSLASSVALVYADTSGTNRLVVKRFSASAELGSVTINTAGSSPSDVDCDAKLGDVLWVAYAIEGSTNTAYALALNATSLATVGTVTDFADFDTCSNLRICASTTTQTARAFVLAANLGGIHIDVADLVIIAGAVADTFGATIYNLLPVSRPFCRAGRYYMAVAPSPTSVDLFGLQVGNRDQALCVLVDWTENGNTVRPIAHVEPGLVPGVALFAKINDAGSNRYVLGFSLLKSGGTTGNLLTMILNSNTFGLAVAEFDFVDLERWRTAERGGSTFITGGLLSTFDGARVCESGFLARPQAPSVDVSGGSGLTAATGYRYVAIYEDVDANGNLVVSGISTPSDLTGPFTNKAPVVTVPTLSVTSRIAINGDPGTVRVGFYRTLDGGSPPYYRLRGVTVDPSVSVVTFTDGDQGLGNYFTDAQLAQQAKLYAPQLPGTVGESLDRRAPPGLRHIVTYAGMLVGAKGSSLYWSGQEVYGEGAWFSPVFELPITGGEITALAVQDGALLVFKRDCIYVLSGEPPSDNGAVGGLGQPRLLASDVGCIDANSIVACALGVFFQSERGIELFSRAQTVEWIGEQVQDTLAAYPVVTSAVLDVRNSLVRISLTRSYEPDGSVTAPNGDDPTDIAGKTLVFDLVLKGWISVDDYASRQATQHACYLGDRYAWLNSSGVVNEERDATDAAVCLDGSSWVASSFTLPPWKLGLQQDQRVYEMMLLFERRSAAGLTIEVADDYGAFGAVTADKVWTEAGIVSAVADAPQVSFVPHESGYATQLRVTDTAPATLGTGQGFVWIGFSADISPKQGSTRGTPRLNPSHRR